MHILIISDLEGIIGVKDLRSESAKLLLIKETAVIIETFKRLGVNNIYVCLTHDNGRMLEQDDLNFLGCKYYRGCNEIDFSIAYDFAIFNGFHSMKGTGGLFNHTFRDEIVEILYKGRNVGEIELFSMWLLKHNIQTVLVTGDEFARHEVHRIGVKFCSVKDFSVMKNTESKGNMMYIKIFLELVDLLDQEHHYRETCEVLDDDEIYIRFITDEIAIELGKINYNYRNGYIIFNSFEEFLSNTEVFSHDLNVTSQKIVNSNIPFVRRIKKYKYLFLDAPYRIRQILTLPVMLLDDDYKEELDLYIKSCHK